MKRMLGILSLAAACLPVCAQYQLENAGFESWENVSYKKSLITTIKGEEPLHWNSFITGSGDLKYTACQGSQLFSDTDVRPGTTGTKSAKLTAKKVLGIYAQGNMTTGQINMGHITASNASGNYNATRVDNDAYNQKITGRPDSMVVWLKFYTSKSEYRAKANSILHTSGYYQDPEGNTLTATVIAKAENLDIEPLNKMEKV